LEKLVAHPDNPNRMSKSKFAKILRNIERTGLYEPLVVRPCPHKSCYCCAKKDSNDKRRTCFQIINGHNRWRVLKELGHKTAEVIIWDIDDNDTDIMLATLNHLGGSDILDKKMTLLRRLNQSAFCGQASELSKLLPQTASQIKRLTELNIADCRKAVNNHKSQTSRPLVFFLSDQQQAIVQKALSAKINEQKPVLCEAEGIGKSRTKAVKNAAALTFMAQDFINSHQSACRK
jgi:ParB-like chromosome segregation protein Spo0J